jgi:HrpA-like RNA helicase
MWARLGLAAKNAMDARPFASDEAAFVKWRPEVKIENFEDVEIPNHILASSVPIANRYAELIHTISSNSVTIVSAETGYGN